MADHLRKDEANKLGEMLGYEIERALAKGEQFPFQRIGKTLAARMVEKELIEPREVRRPSALGAFTVKGYELTHRGRILYCALCKEEVTPS